MASRGQMLSELARAKVTNKQAEVRGEVVSPSALFASMQTGLASDNDSSEENSHNASNNVTPTRGEALVQASFEPVTEVMYKSQPANSNTDEDSDDQTVASEYDAEDLNYVPSPHSSLSDDEGKHIQTKY